MSETREPKRERRGCCVDGACTDATCMALPDGSTCSDCKYFSHCKYFIWRRGSETHCDWFPRRFVSVEEHHGERVRPSGPYLLSGEKEAELAMWNSQDEIDLADEGVREWMQSLNDLSGVCTVQSCVGHTVDLGDGVRHVENGAIEMRLSREMTDRFYGAMGRLSCLDFVEDVEIMWRPGYQICSVIFSPGSMPSVVSCLVSELGNG